ncbi:nicotinate-nicotinamide nucleotide adenylyltransferase [Litoribacillus peritrichatus]|uniref:nicotinate-nucleotide adenylyltransferase n=1 Tax=Litoribacillus peritrichatus TaxID=718191 RepID=A0ABP7N8M3_9GAMM
MIGVFGSAFNPPTLGHKSAIQQAALQCDKIILVPSASHAFGKKMLAYDLRLQLLKHFISDIQPDVPCPLEVSTIESQMIAAGYQPIYTFDVLQQLENKLNTDQLKFILGPDNAAPSTWGKFYKSQEIDQNWGKIECNEAVKIRSTNLRDAVKAGNTEAQLWNFTTPGVARFICDNGLYNADD